MKSRRRFEVGIVLACLHSALSAAAVSGHSATMRDFHVTPFEFVGDVRSLPGPPLAPSGLAPGELRPMDDGVGEEEPRLPGELRRSQRDPLATAPQSLGPLALTPAPLA